MSPWFTAAAAIVAALALWHIVHTINDEHQALDLRADALDRWARDLDRRETEAAKWFDQ